jgi:formylglycine-generating enzyme required for sulfatase activity
MLQRLKAASCVAALLLAVPVSAQTPALDTMLDRAGRYVAQFIERFANVVAEERYVQDTLGNLPVVTGRGGIMRLPPPSRHRELRSDFLLVRLGANDFLPFRDVFEVDGTPIRDREGRLAKLFLEPSATSLEQAGKISTESARYNLGAVQRTINTPILPLVFLQLDTQSHFRYVLGKRDVDAGENVWIVDYKELARPTFVRGIRDSDLPATGRYWIDAETGRVVKTELDLDSSGVRARLTTSYRRDERFQIDVPFEMQERYYHDRGQVSGVATYGRFRKFNVSADESFHDPTAATVTERRTGLALVEIPSGRFTMGSPATELGRRGDEAQHDVTIDRPFFLGQHEVTQQEWRAVVSMNPSRFGECGPRCPVENVTFADVQQFLAVLNAQPDNELVYRLPTEAEWEYACRAGTVTPFSTGDVLTTAQANYNGKQPYGGAAPGMSRERPTRAAGFEANAWGLADMHGNVWEWTADWYGAYPAGESVGTHGAPAGGKRVVRGGSWQTGAASVRCATRSAVDPGAHDAGLGFRVAGDRISK